MWSVTEERARTRYRDEGEGRYPMARIQADETLQPSPWGVHKCSGVWKRKIHENVAQTSDFQIYFHPVKETRTLTTLTWYIYILLIAESRINPAAHSVAPQYRNCRFGYLRVCHGISCQDILRAKRCWNSIERSVLIPCPQSCLRDPSNSPHETKAFVSLFYLTCWVFRKRMERQRNSTGAQYWRLLTTSTLVYIS